MFRVALILSLLATCATSSAQEVRVPAFTAYIERSSRAGQPAPAPEQRFGGRAGGPRVLKSGISGWKEMGTNVSWFGQLNRIGDLSAVVDLKLPAGQTVGFRLTVGAEAHEAKLIRENGRVVSANFGTFRIQHQGYVRFRLESLEEDMGSGVQVGALVLSGPAAEGAHFNLSPRRNAASVHLSYPVDSRERISAFYCEMTGVEDPLWTYYMACGWHRGYFGIQVISSTERRVIFSVWDSGDEAFDRSRVANENRVHLVAKGEGVYSGDFGNEGTGGHSHLKFAWKTGDRQRFLVTAEPTSKNHTVFSGYYFRPDLQEWTLISSWKAPREGQYMRRLYSFSENFVGRNGHLVRKALFGNQWIRKADGKWLELTSAKFSHDQTGESDRQDRFMGIEDGQFFLSHGGFLKGYTQAGESFTREPTLRSPASQPLPPLPAVQP